MGQHLESRTLQTPPFNPLLSFAQPSQPEQSPHLLAAPKEQEQAYQQTWRGMVRDSVHFLRAPENSQILGHYREIISEMSSSGYPPEQIQFVKEAFIVSVTHQLNEDERKRMRAIDKIPYVLHPISMARDALASRLHASHIAADLTHDFSEDVTYKNLRTPADRKAFLEWKFGGKPWSDSYQQTINAETQTENFDHLAPEEKAATIEHILHTPHGRLARNETINIKQRLGLKEITPEEEQDIALVIYDTMRLLSTGLSEGPEDKPYSHLGSLAAKIRDTADNLRTPGFWSNNLDNPKKIAKTVTKYLRARTLANAARFMGMRRLSSEMAHNLSLLGNPYDIYNQHLGSAAPQDNGEGMDSVDFNNTLLTHCRRTHFAPVYLESDDDTAPKSQPNEPRIWYETPWGTRMNDIPVTRGQPPITNITIPVARARHEKVKSRITTDLMPLANPINSPRMSVTATRLIPAESLVSRIAQTIGRPTSEWKIFDSSADLPLGKVVLETKYPSLVGLLKFDKDASSEYQNVPEHNIFHPDVVNYTRSEEELAQLPQPLRDVDIRWADFMAFMLSPNAYLQQEGQKSFVMFVNKRMFLVRNNWKGGIRDICNQQNLTGPYDYRALMGDDSWHPVDESANGTFMTSEVGVSQNIDRCIFAVRSSPGENIA